MLEWKYLYLRNWFAVISGFYAIAGLLWISGSMSRVTECTHYYVNDTLGQTSNRPRTLSINSNDTTIFDLHTTERNTVRTGTLDSIIHVTSGTVSIKQRGIMSGRILWYQPPNFQHILDSEKSIDFSKCGFPNNCTHTLNTAYMSSSDAVIFHGTQLPPDMPKRRKDQFWIMYTLESPINVQPMREMWRRQFDWMMNYRTDSDIFLPYGNIYRRKHLERVDFNIIMKKKEQPIAWLVSNCHASSRRDLYVNELKKHVNVSVFGRCGKIDPALNDIQSMDAHRILSVKHKFYLSFENTYCTDYITEKVFNVYSSKTHMIPIVRGKGNYTKVLPRGTYINTDDFSSIQELAKYIQYLNDNDAEYIKMLKEKTKYDVLDMMEVYHQSLCRICEKIQNPQEIVQVNRKEAVLWMHQNDSCVTPNDIK